MNTNLIKRSLGFHGQPMQMIWEDEHATCKFRLDSLTQIDYSVYQERQKHFSFKDRAKRLKLHQFFAKKANELFDSDINVIKIYDVENSKVTQFYATTPPYENFVKNKKEPTLCWRTILEAIEPGDVLYGVVSKCSNPLVIKPLCTAEPLIRCLNEVPAKAFVQISNTGVLTSDNQKNCRRYSVGDYICSVVLELSIDADRLYLTLESTMSKNKNVKLGSIEYNSLPQYYLKSLENGNKKYVESLLLCKEFLNPNYDMLFNINGLNIHDTFSMMKFLKAPPRQDEFAEALRQNQANQWAVRSVVQGITLFRDGHHIEAFQSLNKALSIDPKNVEGLVARGALYANKRSFLKAIEDFETALKLNPLHANAKNYIAETLVALGLSYEDNKKIPEAIKSYQECLKWVPKHKQAIANLTLIQTRKSCQPYLHLITDCEALTVASDPVCNTNSQTNSTKISDNALVMSPLSHRMILHAASIEKGKNLDMWTSKDNIPNVNDIEKSASLRSADETLSQVRKLLHKASKYKKEKKKKHRTTKSRSSSPKIREKLKKSKCSDYISTINVTCEDQMTHSPQYKSYKKYLSTETRTKISPPPPPPNITSLEKSNSIQDESSRKLSFQIRRPVKIDKFGLVRIATPLTQESSSSASSKSRSRSRSPRNKFRSRSRSRSPRYKSRSRSRSRSPRNKSRSKSIERDSYRRKSYYRSRRMRSRSNSMSRRSFNRSYHTNLRSHEPSLSHSLSRYSKGRSPNNSTKQPVTSKESLRACNINDPSIEEIDELLFSSQKDRKRESSNRGNEIFKKRN